MSAAVSETRSGSSARWWSIVLPGLVLGVALWWFSEVPTIQTPPPFPDGWTPAPVEERVTWHELPALGDGQRRVIQQVDVAHDRLLTLEQQGMEREHWLRSLTDGTVLAELPQSNDLRPATSVGGQLALATVLTEVLPRLELYDTDALTWVRTVQLQFGPTVTPLAGNFRVLSYVEHPAGDGHGVLGVIPPFDDLPHEDEATYFSQLQTHWFHANRDGRIDALRALECADCNARPYPEAVPTQFILSAGPERRSRGTGAIDVLTGERVPMPREADGGFGALYPESDQAARNRELVQRLTTQQPRLSQPPRGNLDLEAFVGIHLERPVPRLYPELSVPEVFESRLLDAPDSVRERLTRSLATLRRLVWSARYRQSGLRRLQLRSIRVDGLALQQDGERQPPQRLLTGDVEESTRRELLNSVRTFTDDPTHLSFRHFPPPGLREALLTDVSVLPLREGQYLVLQVLHDAPSHVAIGNLGLLRIGLLDQDATDARWCVALPLDEVPDCEAGELISPRLLVVRGGDRLLLALSPERPVWANPAWSDIPQLTQQLQQMPQSKQFRDALVWCVLPLPAGLEGLPEGPLE